MFRVGLAEVWLSDTVLKQAQEQAMIFAHRFDTNLDHSYTNCDIRSFSTLLLPQALLLLAVIVVSMFYAPMANADKNSDQLLSATKMFHSTFGVAGDGDSAVAKRAGELERTARQLAKEGKGNFGSSAYIDKFAQVKSLVAEIGTMEMNPTKMVLESWRAVRGSVDAIQNALPKQSGSVTFGPASQDDDKGKPATQQNRNDGKAISVGATDGEPSDAEPIDISATKNSPDAGMHIDQVEDLSERVKNAFRDLTSRDSDMRARPWAERLDGMFSRFDNKANRLRDKYKAQSNWQPELVAMKKQAVRIDRVMQKRDLQDADAYWNQLKNHLEQI